MLEELRWSVAVSLSYASQSDLFPRHKLTIIEDKETLAGADAYTVRHAFRVWIADDLAPRLHDPEQYGGVV